MNPLLGKGSKTLPLHILVMLNFSMTTFIFVSTISVIVVVFIIFLFQLI